MSDSPIKKVNMIILMQPDLQQALSFYEKLGLHKQFELENRWIEFVIGEVKLGLCATAQPPTERRTGIVLEVEDLPSLYEQLKDSIEFSQAPVESAHGIMATIKDPGGNYIDLYQPTPEKFKDALSKVEK